MEWRREKGIRTFISGSYGIAMVMKDRAGELFLWLESSVAEQIG